MKGYVIPLLSTVFIVLVIGSVQFVFADHSLEGEGIYEDENSVNLALTIDSKYQIYLHVVIRNAQDQLVSVSEAMHGKYIPHEITDFVFDNMKSKREVIIIDKIKYEKINYTMTYDIQQASFTKSYVDFLTTWALEFELNIDGHGLVQLPVFQASAPLTLAEGDILTFQWTILREMN
jgi:hypothetical protein